MSSGVSGGCCAGLGRLVTTEATAGGIWEPRWRRGVGGPAAPPPGRRTVPRRRPELGPGSARELGAGRRGAGPARGLGLRAARDPPGQGRGRARGCTDRLAACGTDSGPGSPAGPGRSRRRAGTRPGAAQGERGGGAGTGRAGAPRRRDVERVGPRALAAPRGIRPRLLRGWGFLPCVLTHRGAQSPQPCSRRRSAVVARGRANGLAPGDGRTLLGERPGGLPADGECEGWATDHPGMTVPTPLSLSESASEMGMGEQARVSRVPT